MPEKNVFVLGLDESNEKILRQIPHADEYRFHRLLAPEELQQGQVDIKSLLSRAEEKLDGFDGQVDAIVGYWDFPVSLMVPMLCEKYGLRSSSLESVAKCEHKYWSRLEQRKVIDELPGFGIVDLDGDAKPPEGMSYPMWLKPVKSTSSDLAFKADDDDTFADAVAEIRNGIGRIGRPFEYILSKVDLPPEVAEAGGQACLAEESLQGIQVAVEGYVRDGKVTVYGALDSLDYPGSSTFLRHQYPSSLPDSVVARLTDISVRVIEQVGMDSTTFSIEFFYDPLTDGLALLEVNPRHSQSHAELFAYVDGRPNHHCMVSLALGRDPALPDGKGRYALAAKWYYRRFRDGLVTRAPTQRQIGRIEEEIPGVAVEVQPEQGRLLSDQTGQDSYSFELAHIFVGANDEFELRAKYERCVEALDFEFAEPGTPGA